MQETFPSAIRITKRPSARYAQAPDLLSEQEQLMLIENKRTRIKIAETGALCLCGAMFAVSLLLSLSGKNVGTSPWSGLEFSRELAMLAGITFLIAMVLIVINMLRNSIALELARLDAISYSETLFQRERQSLLIAFLLIFTGLGFLLLGLF